MQLMTFFGLVALLLAATGLYGVLSYVVDQRRREVGIRISLGASPIQVIELIAKQGFWPVALGMAAGLIAASAAARLLKPCFLRWARTIWLSMRPLPDCYFSPR
jgi:ABC-type antimicrobial peptide transport system permease subunit